jgi:DNA repair protein RadA/Sms
MTAYASSHKLAELPTDLVVFGEVGLTGEVRPAARGMERLKEAYTLGFTRAAIPSANALPTQVLRLGGRSPL